MENLQLNQMVEYAAELNTCIIKKSRTLLRTALMRISEQIFLRIKLNVKSELCVENNNCKNSQSLIITDRNSSIKT